VKILCSHKIDLLNQSPAQMVTILITVEMAKKCSDCGEGTGKVSNIVGMG